MSSAVMLSEPRSRNAVLILPRSNNATVLPSSSTMRVCAAESVIVSASMSTPAFFILPLLLAVTVSAILFAVCSISVLLMRISATLTSAMSTGYCVLMNKPSKRANVLSVVITSSAQSPSSLVALRSSSSIGMPSASAPSSR